MKTTSLFFIDRTELTVSLRHTHLLDQLRHAAEALLGRGGQPELEVHLLRVGERTERAQGPRHEAIAEGRLHPRVRARSGDPREVRRVKPARSSGPAS